jgi:hypothetical protein
LNLGLRYEPTKPWHEIVGRIQIFDLDAYHAGRSARRSTTMRRRTVLPWGPRCARRRDTGLTMTT